jgi:hypothetical protein
MRRNINRIQNNNLLIYPPASEGAVAFVTITDLPNRESKST